MAGEAASDGNLHISIEIATLRKELVDCLRELDSARPYVADGFEYAVLLGFFIIFLAGLYILVRGILIPAVVAWKVARSAEIQQAAPDNNGIDGAVADADSGRQGLHDRVSRISDVIKQSEGPVGIAAVVAALTASGAVLLVLPTLSAWSASYLGGYRSPLADGAKQERPIGLDYRGEKICLDFIEEYYDRDAIVAKLQGDITKLKKLNVELAGSGSGNNGVKSQAEIEATIEKASNTIQKENPLLGYSIPVFYKPDSLSIAREIDMKLRDAGANTKLIMTDLSEIKGQQAQGVMRLVYSTDAPPSALEALKDLAQGIETEAGEAAPVVLSGPFVLRAGPMQVQVF